MAYTALILTTAGGADYSMIRLYLDADSTAVPAATIEDYGFLPYVEAEVTTAITNYGAILTAGGANMYRLKTGVAAWVAALLCQHIAVGEMQGVQIGEHSEHASKLDWRQKAADLIALSANALAGVSTRTHTRMSLVKLAGPTLSGSNVPDDEEEWLEKIQPRFLDWIEEGGEDD